MNSHDIHRRPSTVSRILFQQIKRTEIEWNKQRMTLMAKVDGITALGQGHHPEGHEDGVTSLLGPREQSSKSQRIILRPQNLMKFALLDFRLVWNMWPLFSFKFLPFGMGVSIYACPIAFQKQITSFPVSQVCGWKVILAQNRLYPMSHLYLT